MPSDPSKGVLIGRFHKTILLQSDYHEPSEPDLLYLYTNVAFYAAYLRGFRNLFGVFYADSGI